MSAFVPLTAGSTGSARQFGRRHGRDVRRLFTWLWMEAFAAGGPYRRNPACWPALPAW
ncbi:MAG: hypothetical protein IPM01_03580 [Burkholderiaceae bacterium]|nr:hypothetical protein [Burkholderiaceae bacterium]